MDAARELCGQAAKRAGFRNLLLHLHPRTAPEEAAFDLRAELHSPPAPRPLDLFPLAIESGTVKVDTRRRVQRSHLESDPVSGLWEIR
jgi:hypothetical protein